MTDPIIEAAARALQDALGNKLLPMPHRHIAASVVITAVTPLIRAKALEEAAKVLEPFARQDFTGMMSFEELDLEKEDFHRARDFLSRIRALKEQP
jgi:hypothetical protein